MEYLQIDVYDLTVFNKENKEVAHFNKLNDVKLQYIHTGDFYDLTVNNVFLHTDYLKFIGTEKEITDYESRLRGKKTTISIKNDKGKECKLIAKSRLYDPETNKEVSEIVIEIPRAFTALKPSFTGKNGEAYETVANFKIEASEDLNDGEFFKIHIW